MDQSFKLSGSKLSGSKLHDKLIIEYNKLYIYYILQKYRIHESWHQLFYSVSDRLVNLLQKIENQKKTKIIYPQSNLIFKVFEKDIKDIKILLLGQDPYHGPGQAMGLSFSVPNGVPIPPSLWNIFKELKIEYPEQKYDFKHGDLTKWSNNGIFLLNSALTVIEKTPNSHQELWSWFTDLVIDYIDNNRNNVVFLLLGKNAGLKQIYIDDSKNHIITGVHPSPLSANNGFFKSNIFKRVDDKLKEPFNWLN